MSAWTKQAWKVIKNLLDDAFLLCVTVFGVLVYSYIDTIRGVLVRHDRPEDLPWPGAVAVVLAVLVGLIVVAIDASRGTPEQKKALIKGRIGKSLILGIGALAALEKLILGGA